MTITMADQAPQDNQDENVLLRGNYDYETVGAKISDVVLTKTPPKQWYLGLGVGFLLLMMFLFSAMVLLVRGVGVWGLNVPVAWGFAIINFVWWIGIGHAGTLISAVLLLLNQPWRTSINRFAEAMTLFAVACAAMFPLLHLGRIWVFYWLMPYPNTMGLWPQFRSPLVWDVFAVTTYALTSLLFWYVGLIPDLATLRDRTKHRGVRTIYGMLALGWRGSARHWQRYERAYLLLAALATPLVLSVHTIVSFDFSVSILPGWHATIFPPYFVAGAVFAGFAMVLTLAIPLRKLYKMEDMITEKHLENCAKVMLATGLIVVYGYAMEAFTAWYSAADYERFMMKNRVTGPYGYIYAMLLLCNFISVQFLWLKKVRTTPIMLFIVAMFVNVGMWLERFVIVITSLHRDFLTSSWDMYAGTRWDWSLFIGTMGLFLTLLFLFLRVLPMISIFEMREMIHKNKKGH
ncbi:MAG: Ni/Fe-hydrogenase subunit HybB-like protein [Kiritimatiellia bacterium]|jgi:Ni/Fe-hydrogenase subunit HybB-like protein